MRVVVCIKQVPDTTEVRINPETNTLIREGVPSIVNPFDLYAVEEGLRIKERLGGEVIGISMGPPQTEEALRELIAMGIDQTILVSDPALAGSDTLTTSLALAWAIERLNPFDLIICGKQAIDGDTAQVGPGIAAWLDLPQAAFVRRIDELNLERIRLQILREEGYESLELSLPCLISVVKEINEPRLPSLRGRLRARNYQIPIWNLKYLGLESERVGLQGSPTRVIRIFTPPAKESGEVFKGDLDEGVERLILKLESVLGGA